MCLTPFFLLLTICALAAYATSECGQQFMSGTTSQVLQSQNFPFDYLSGITCRYQFFTTRTDSSVLCFKFHRFDVGENDPNCTHSYLGFYNSSSEQILRYCGSGQLAWSQRHISPVTYHNLWLEQFCWPASSRIYNVTFVSSSSSPGHRGFYATFTSQDVDGLELCLQTHKLEKEHLDENLTWDETKSEQTNSDDSTTVDNATDDTACLNMLNSDTIRCRDDEWTCFDRSCIPKNKVCDLTEDCADSSDEDYTHARCDVKDFGALRSCNFEMNYWCNFLGRHLWRRTRSGTASVDRAPRADHTVGKPGEGHYWFANLTSARLGEGAYFQTPAYRLEKKACLSFYYYMKGALTVELAMDGWLTLWHRKGATGSWQLAQLELPAMNHTVLRFTANKTQINSWVALDDLYVADGSCIWVVPSCTFAINSCGWTAPQSFKATSTWERKMNPSGGSAVVYSVTGALWNETTTFCSPIISSHKESYCLSMVYSVWESKLYSWEVKQTWWDTRLAQDVITHQNSLQENEKVLAEYNVTSLEPFSIVLQLSVATNGSIHFALSDISITAGHCGVEETSVTAVTDENDCDEVECGAPPVENGCSGEAGADCKDRAGLGDPVLEDDHPEDTRKIDSEENGTQDGGDSVESIVSFSAIGVGALVIISLVVTVAVFLVRMRKNPMSTRRPRTRSNNSTATSCGAADAEDPTPDFTDQPPSYSAAMRQSGMPRPTTFQMQVLSISAQVDAGVFDSSDLAQRIVIERRPPPPPYDAVVAMSAANGVASDVNNLDRVTLQIPSTTEDASVQADSQNDNIIETVAQQSVQENLPDSSPTNLDGSSSPHGVDNTAFSNVDECAVSCEDTSFSGDVAELNLSTIEQQDSPSLSMTVGCAKGDGDQVYEQTASAADTCIVDSTA